MTISLNIPPEQLERLKKDAITPEGSPVGPFWVDGAKVMLEMGVYAELESLQAACKECVRLNEAFHLKHNPHPNIYKWFTK